MNTQPIPLVDLKLQHRRVSEEVSIGMARVFENTSFILGPEVGEFEREFARYCQVQHVVGVANGTDALELALRGAGIGQGDEVIIPANTFVATAEAVVRAGARIVLADCDNDYLIDPRSVAERTTARTRAVIAVHLYGQMAPMRKLREQLSPEILLIEDAAQSQGARHYGQPAGSFGEASGTSFYPGKNLGAYGDAGAVMTNSDLVADRVRQIGNHGGTRRYEHLVVGCNSRMDTMQAVVLSSKLAWLDDWNDERRRAAEIYCGLLADTDRVVLPQVADGNEHVWHLFVVQVPDRDTVLADLNRQGIGAGIHYPAPVHFLPAFGDLPYEHGDFPNSESAAARILSLPLFPGIREDQQVRVVRALNGAVRAAR